MRHNSGVQGRFLQTNSRALFTPCACHYYNFLLDDMVKTCPDAMTFFGTLKQIYTIFPEPEINGQISEVMLLVYL